MGEDSQLRGVEFVEARNSQETGIRPEVRVGGEGDFCQPAAAFVIRPVTFLQPILVGRVDAGNLLQPRAESFNGSRKIVREDAGAFEFLNRVPKSRDEARFGAQRRVVSHLAAFAEIVYDRSQEANPHGVE